MGLGEAIEKDQGPDGQNVPYFVRDEPEIHS
jgi:hypothetical protein